MRKNFGPAPLLYPQPVMIIGTWNEDGTANAMNAAWGGIAGNDTIIIDLGAHKTTENILKNKDFTVSIADAPHLVEADYVGIVSGNKVPDKVEKAGLHAKAAENVNAPYFEEFPLTLECRFLESTPYGIAAKILNVTADESILDEKGGIDPAKLQAITYDPYNHDYIVLGETVGHAFSDGNKLK